MLYYYRNFFLRHAIILLIVPYYFVMAHSDTSEEQPNLSIYDTPTPVTASLEEEDSNVIPRRLWVYLLRRQGIELVGSWRIDFFKEYTFTV